MRTTVPQLFTRLDVFIRLRHETKIAIARFRRLALIVVFAASSCGILFAADAFFPAAIDPIVGADVLLATNSQNPSIAFNGNLFFVSWLDRRNGRFEVYGSRVASTGVVLDPGGLWLGSPREPNFNFAPALASNGRDFLVAWGDGGEVYRNFITSEGIVKFPGGTNLSPLISPRMDPAVASDGTNFVVLHRLTRLRFAQCDAVEFVRRARVGFCGVRQWRREYIYFLPKNHGQPRPVFC